LAKQLRRGSVKFRFAQCVRHSFENLIPKPALPFFGSGFFGEFFIGNAMGTPIGFALLCLRGRLIDKLSDAGGRK